ncbi:MAG: GAF domain-containing sensor histidine kinase [Ginsengibacter sp.]
MSKEEQLLLKNSLLEKELAAKNRELEIEASLERVREKAMAMRASEELKEVVKTLFEELTHLDVNLQACLIATFDPVTSDQRSWIIHLKSNEPYSLLIPYNEQPFYQEMLHAWKERNANWSYMLEDEPKISWENFLFNDTEFRLLPKEVKEEMGKPKKVFFAASYYPYGAIQASSPELLSNTSIDLLKRFSKVFDSCYTRFLDLKKAESQAREAHIQLALERVRAKTMAMQKPSEFVDVINIIGEQFMHLGFDFDWVNFSANGLDVSKAIDIYNFHVTPGLYQGATRVVIPFFEHPVFKKAEESVNEYRTSGNSFTVVLLGKKDKDTWLDHLFRNTIYKDLPGAAKTSQYNREVYQSSNVVLNDTWLSVGKYDAKPLTNEQIAILKRLANEFGQAYTRFLDLQKAEAQAREAQIEAGLERVRSRAMGMQSSEELAPLIGTVFTELIRLDLVLTRCVILIYEGNKKGVRWWMANSEAPSEPMNFFVKYADMAFFNEYMKGWQEKLFKWQYILEGENKVETDNFLFKETELSRLPNFVITGMRTPDRIYLNASFNNFGNLTLASLEPLSDEHFDILLRFAKVFDLTYTRFNDLKQAEAQAREAQIEASLERVRGKAMAMHTSQDLSDTIGVFYHELESFSLTPIRCGVGLLEKEERIGELYTWYTTEKGQSLELVGRLKMEGHPVLNKIYEGWSTQTEYHPVLRGDEIKEYNKILKPQMAFPDYKHDDVQFGYFFFFPEGGVYAWTEKEMHEDELQIYRRFTSVLSLTYKRYRDLEKAEASTKEALKQSALDRIRADIASMRTISDLDRITPLIWNELTILGVPFIRCGVFIMDDEQQRIHTFLSTPEGKGIAAFHLPYNTPGNIARVITHWQKKEIYTDHWDEEAFREFADNLVKQGAMQSSKPYLSTMPARGFDLHFVPFQQGMLYVGNITPLGEEEINLLQSIADAFSTAYARYEDFNKLEAAKRQVDKTLTELRQTQQQLIQSEKMASLGELTAGIAHEIQNPLNFVNNFSDVNIEMLEELKAERLKPDAERDESLQNELIKDVIENSEKINHHGKRADAIVKGMLQHSRKSSGQKEPTDINALADEYLRLSYHGIRAKDKNFNATIETDFDNSIGKINVIPQDIGRVLLNLFNNAFYVVNEQKNLNVIFYEPKVFVQTQKCDDKIQITVKDNGSGIPQKILDKIFQPFFTTKPTGQGTGLGLSLSYDIVKAHGGEIKVESKEGEGSEFLIQLPA